MATGIQFRDLTSAELERLQGALEPVQLSRVAAHGVGLRLKDHFQDLERDRPNKMGWPRQHFWSGARQAISEQYSGARVTLSITKPGVALHYFGGVVRPIIAEMLTIPAVAEAYGKRARERGDLILTKRENPKTGKLQLCLVKAEQSAAILGPRSKKTGKRRFKKSTATGGEVIYWLARKVTIKPDKTVLPTDDQLETAAGEAVESTLQRIQGRRGR